MTYIYIPTDFNISDLTRGPNETLPICVVVERKDIDELQNVVAMDSLYRALIVFNNEELMIIMASHTDYADTVRSFVDNTKIETKLDLDALFSKAAGKVLSEPLFDDCYGFPIYHSSLDLRTFTLYFLLVVVEIIKSEHQVDFTEKGFRLMNVTPNQSLVVKLDVTADDYRPLLEVLPPREGHYAVIDVALGQQPPNGTNNETLVH